jgi:hypothetical protein
MRVWLGVERGEEMAYGRRGRVFGRAKGLSDVALGKRLEFLRESHVLDDVAPRHAVVALVLERLDGEDALGRRKKGGKNTGLTWNAPT